jgi:hypothetical protein
MFASTSQDQFQKGHRQFLIIAPLPEDIPARWRSDLIGGVGEIQHSRVRPYNAVTALRDRLLTVNGCIFALLQLSGRGRHESARHSISASHD